MFSILIPTWNNLEYVVPRPGHLGLIGMRERALAVGAVVSVQSLPGVHSCVRFERTDVSAFVRSLIVVGR